MSVAEVQQGQMWTKQLPTLAFNELTTTQSGTSSGSGTVDDAGCIYEKMLFQITQAVSIVYI